MSSSDSAFVTWWRVQGAAAEVHDVLGGAAPLPRWWPSIYPEVQVLDPGDALGAGKTVELLTQGWLPSRS